MLILTGPSPRVQIYYELPFQHFKSISYNKQNKEDLIYFCCKADVSFLENPGNILEWDHLVMLPY